MTSQLVTKFTGARTWLDYQESEFYTDGDVVKGTVQVQVEREITVSEIVVKLRCLERAEVARKEDRTENPEKRDKRSKVSEYRHLDLIKTVWPPAHISEALPDATKHTLRKGNHSIPIEVAFPNALKRFPSSVAVEEKWGRAKRRSGFFWTVRVSVRRSDMFAPNPRWSAPIKVFPWVPLPDMGPRSRVDAQSVPLYKREEGLKRLFKSRTAVGSVQGKLSLPKAGLAQEPNPLGLRVELSGAAGSSSALLILKSLTVVVSQRLEIRVDSGQTEVQEHKVLDVLVPINEDVGKGDNELVIEDELSHLTISDVSPRCSGRWVHCRTAVRVFAHLISGAEDAVLKLEALDVPVVSQAAGVSEVPLNPGDSHKGNDGNENPPAYQGPSTSTGPPGSKDQSSKQFSNDFSSKDSKNSPVEKQ